MNDKDAIINKIIDNANLKAQEIIDEANSKKAEILKDAKAKAKAYRLETLPNTNALVDDLVERGKVLSELEAKKIILAKKKSIIEDVFTLVVKDLKNDKKSYTALIDQMISANAETGDVVQFSKEDKVLFDEKYIADLGKKLKIELKLDKTYGDFIGGVLITNKTCDKNLTLEVELDELRSTMESDIAKQVFGDK